MAGLVEWCLVCLSFHDHCFDGAAVYLAHHQLAEQALG